MPNPISRYLCAAVLPLVMSSITPVANAQKSRAEIEPAIQRQIMELTYQGLEAAKRKDPTFKQRTLTDDALDVGDFGVWDKAKSAASIA